MAQVITGLDNIPLSAISAAYAPTNTADVTAMIDSAVSGKLDASASSSFQPVGNYVSSDDLSAYLPTSSIGVDSASAVTSIAGSSVGGGTDITYNIDGSSFTATGFQTSHDSSYSTTAISHVRDSADDRPLEASYLKPGTIQQSGSAYKLAFSPAQSMWTTADVATGIFSPLQYGTGAGMFMDNSSFKGYLKGNEIFISNTAIGKAARMEVHGTRDARVGLTGDKNGNVTANFKPSEISFCSAGVATATYGRTKIGLSSTASGTAAYGINYINLYDTSESAQKTISSTSVDYWNAKLDASSIETSVDGITGIGGTAIAGGGTTYTAGQYIQISGDEISVTGLQPSGDYVSSSELDDYQPTSSMSAYATTGDLSSKLDASASSSFITSTSDCMPLSASSDYYSTSNPAGYITGVDLTPYQTTAGMSGYIATSSIGVDTADSITSIAGSAIAGGGGGGMVTAIGTSNSGITSINSTGLVDTAALRSADYTSLYVEEPLYISSSGDSAYIGFSGDYVSSSELANYQTTAGMSAYLPTSAIGVDTASSLITGINGSALSAGSTYSAGQYVQISGDEISVTGLQPSGSYVSSTDLSSYQTVDGMSAYATTGDLSAKLDASASSAFLTAQEQASWSETASASPSYIVDKPDLVDIVAGPGIVVDNPDGNTLRVSNEYDVETVLFNGTASQSITTNETVANFEYIDVYVFTPANSSVENIVRMNVGSTVSFVLYAGTISNQFHLFMGVVSASSTTVAISDSGHMWLNKSSAVGSENSTNIKISKVVGIHRIANN